MTLLPKSVNGKDEKFILDATAGFRMMWFNKQHPNAIYLDERAECEPDIIGDYRNLSQFKDNSFSLIIFDPPHILKKQKIGNFESNIIRNFGYLNSDTVEIDLKKAFQELWRVLKPMGVLLLKWNTTQVPSNKIIQLAPVPPLIYQITKTERKSNKARNLNVRTLWFCFMKIPANSGCGGEEPQK